MSIGEDPGSHFMKLSEILTNHKLSLALHPFFCGGREKEVIQIFPKSGFL